MKKLIANQLIKVILPALLGAVATYLATSFPAAYNMICTAGVV